MACARIASANCILNTIPNRAQRLLARLQVFSPDWQYDENAQTGNWLARRPIQEASPSGAVLRERRVNAHYRRHPSLAGFASEGDEA